MSTTHASCVTLGECGLLIRGRSGAGKSSLCLSLIDAPGFGFGEEALRAKLVADDQVALTLEGSTLWAAPPPALAGKLELRGLGLVDVPFVANAQVRLVADLLPLADVPRLPEAEALTTEILGLRLPRLILAIGDPLAAARVRSALRHFALV